MKRVTVQITFSDEYYYGQRQKCSKVLRQMVNAAVAGANEQDLEIAVVNTKIGNVRSIKR